MKRSGRILSVILAAMVLLCIAPLRVSANSPGPSIGICFVLTGLPKDTVYVDLLIQLPDSDPLYVDLVEDNLSGGITAQSEIVSYCEDSFRSYTYHYRNAQSLIEVQEYRYVHFFTNDAWEDYSGHREDVYSRGKIRLAMLDREGDIIKVSPTFELRTDGFLSDMIGIFDYNAVTDEFEVREQTSVIAWFVYICLCVLCLLLTVAAEILVAVLFRMKDFLDIIKRTNIVSQILMHSLFVLLYAFVSSNYLLNMLILEVLVYTGEFIYYSKTIWGISAKKCFVYTVTANTASLILGILLLGSLSY